MTGWRKKTIMEMARETKMPYDFVTGEPINLEKLEAFAELVRKDYSTTHANLWLDRIHKFMLEEREACAIVCNDLWEDDGTAYKCAEAIRARGNK